MYLDLSAASGQETRARTSTGVTDDPRCTATVLAVQLKVIQREETISDFLEKIQDAISQTVQWAEAEGSPVTGQKAADGEPLRKRSCLFGRENESGGRGRVRHLFCFLNPPERTSFGSILQREPVRMWSRCCNGQG